MFTDMKYDLVDLIEGHSWDVVKTSTKSMKKINIHQKHYSSFVRQQSSTTADWKDMPRAKQREHLQRSLEAPGLWPVQVGAKFRWCVSLGCIPVPKAVESDD